MPSLRRAFSTSSARVSPYPTLAGSRSLRPHPHGHRRSSGSDVSARKVLADIDWWRVADGQCRQGSEDEDEDEERDVGEENPPSTTDSADPGAPHDATIPQLPDTDSGEGAGVELERPSTPVASESPSGVHIPGHSTQSYLFGQLASFAAGPRTPTRRTASESSVSSLESTPEVIRTPIERPFAGMGFADPGLDIPLFRMRHLASLGSLPLVSKHALPCQSDLVHDHTLADSLMCHDDLFA